MRRAFEFDVFGCPRCGHAIRLVAFIEQPEVIRRILRHLGHPIDVSAPADDADEAASACRSRVADEAGSASPCEEPS